MWRVGLGWRLAQPRQLRSLAALLALEQLVQALAVNRRQGVRQRGVNAPVGAGDGFCAGALNGVYDRQDDALLPEIFDQRTGQYDALVSLQGQLGQRMHRLSVMAHGEGLESEQRLKLNQMLPPGLLALTVLIPAFLRHFELRRHHAQQGRERWLINTQDDARKSQIAKLNSKAKPVFRPAMLANDGQVGFTERVVPDELILGSRQGKQAVALGGRKNRTTGHGGLLENVEF
jgi:hypothetical protein